MLAEEPADPAAGLPAAGDARHPGLAELPEVALDDQQAAEHDPEPDDAGPDVRGEGQDQQHQTAQESERGPTDHPRRVPVQRRTRDLLHEGGIGRVELSLDLLEDLLLFLRERHWPFLLNRGVVRGLNCGLRAPLSRAPAWANNARRGQLPAMRATSTSFIIGPHHRFRSPTGRRRGVSPVHEVVRRERRCRVRVPDGAVARCGEGIEERLGGGGVGREPLGVHLGDLQATGPLGQGELDDLGPRAGLHVEGPEIVVVGPEQRVLEEDLQPPARLPRQHLMPDAGELGHGTVAVGEGGGHDVVDADVAEGLTLMSRAFFAYTI